jgi:hypothetical protein
MKNPLIALCIFGALTARAEVVSLSIGLDVNSPYGISEPWATIRDGLLRLDYVDSVADLPDRKTATGELRTKNGRVPEVQALATALRDLGAGATLRGIEATIHGHVIKEGDELLLKVSRTDERLRLAPFTKPVQRRAEPSDDERNALSQLASRATAEALEVRITGPLRARAAPGAPQTLEVRIFDLPGRSQNQTKNRN